MWVGLGLLLCVCGSAVGFVTGPTKLFMGSARRASAYASPITMQTTTFSSKDFSVNWQKPDAQGSFGKVYFASRGMMGSGGQFVLKCPVNQNFAQTIFETEKVVNQKIDKMYPTPRWAKFLGVIEFSELENMLVKKMDIASQIGVSRESGLIRPKLAEKVIGELLVTCNQIHKAQIAHRDIKPENILVTGGSEPLKVIDFGSSCDVSSGLGVKDISLDPTYAPPEKKIQLNQFGKFDVYTVGMTGLRVLLPSFSKDPRPGVDERVKGCTSLMMQFAEDDLLRAQCNLEKWADNIMKGRDNTMKAEVQELFDGRNKELIALLNGMLQKQVGARLDAQGALKKMGGQWASRI